MSKSVEQAAADYHEAQTEYNSVSKFLPPDDQQVLEAKDRVLQAEYEYDQALKEQESGKKSSSSSSSSSGKSSSKKSSSKNMSENKNYSSVDDGEDSSQENQSSSSNSSSSNSSSSNSENWWGGQSTNDQTCNAQNQNSSSNQSSSSSSSNSSTSTSNQDWTFGQSTENQSIDTSNQSGGVCATGQAQPVEGDIAANHWGYGDGMSSCDPNTQSCVEDHQLFSSTDHFTNAFVTCGPASTLVVPEVSSLVISVRTKGGAPIRDATVELRPSLSGTEPFIRTSNDQGLCMFQLIDNGDYEYAVTKEGFGPTTGGEPGAVCGFLNVKPATTTSFEVNPLHSGPLEIIVFDSTYQAVTTDTVVKGEFITLQAQLPRVIDGEFKWATTSKKIQLLNDTAEFCRVTGRALSDESVYEEIELEFKPKGEKAFPRKTFQCHVIPAKLSITMTDSTGAAITNGLVRESDTIALTAEGLPGQTGVVDWRTQSANIVFRGSAPGAQTFTGKTLEIEGLKPSTSKGAEIVEVTFTPFQGEVVTDQVLVTVVKGAFKKSANNKYGYDEMSGGLNDPPHICVAAGKETFVTLALDANGLSTVDADCEIVFKIEDAACSLGTSNKLNDREFDVQIKAAGDESNAETKLHARLHRPDGPTIATIVINRYKFLSFSATWGMFYDSTSPGTTIAMAPMPTTAGLQRLINGYYAQMCVSVNLSYCGNGADLPIDVQYEEGAKDGTLIYLYGSKSNEQKAIESRFSGSGQKVIVIRAMETHFKLGGEAKQHDTKIKVSPHCSFFRPGTSYTLKDANHTIQIYVQNPVGNNPTELTLDPARMPTGLPHDFAANADLVFPAAGWGGSTIYIPQPVSEQELAETMAHELGHALLTLSDVNDQTSVMYYSVGNTNTRLRFMELTKTYNLGGGATENQWNKPSRSSGVVGWLTGLFK
jgi:hypothetical protein